MKLVYSYVHHSYVTKPVRVSNCNSLWQESDILLEVVRKHKWLLHTNFAYNRPLTNWLSSCGIQHLKDPDKLGKGKNKTPFQVMNGFKLETWKGVL